MKRPSTLLLFAAVAAYLAFFYQLGNFAFLGADEARYARIGEEMNLRGDYVTPTLTFLPWLEKPPLLFWLEALSFHLFGVSEWSARLPVAAIALLGVLCASGLGCSLAGQRAAVLTFFILCASGLFFVYARAASTDMPLAASFTVAMACGLQASRRESPLWGAGAGLTLGLATLAKGPIALVLFCAVFAVYFLWIGKLKWSWQQIALGFLTLLASSFPWYWQVWKENGYDFVLTFWLNHHLARFLTTVHHHSQPFWYYLVVTLIGFFPWVFFLGSSIARLWSKRSILSQPEPRSELFLWLWVLVPGLFFSLSGSKLPGYILPLLPALALLVALEWDRHLDGDLITYRMMRFQWPALAATGLVLILGLVAGFHMVYGSYMGIVLALPLGVGVFWGLRQFRRRQPQAAFISLAGGMLLFAGLAYWKMLPILDDFHSAREVSLVASSEISEAEPLVLYRYFHHTAQYYTGYQTTREAIPDLEALQKYSSEHPQTHYYVLTQKAGWKDLKSLPGVRRIHRQGNLTLAELPGVGE